MIILMFSSFISAITLSMRYLLISSIDLNPSLNAVILPFFQLLYYLLLRMFSGICTNIYFLLPLSSLFNCIVASAVVPEPAKSQG